MSTRGISGYESFISYFLAQFGRISICGESFQHSNLPQRNGLCCDGDFQKLVIIQSTPQNLRDDDVKLTATDPSISV